MAGNGTSTTLEIAHARYEWAKNVLTILTAIAVLVALALLIWLAFIGQHDRIVIKRLVARVTECTTPPEERVPPVLVNDPKNDCYARALRQQGQAVSTISSVSVIAAACGAANPGDVPSTKACVEKELKRR